MFGNGDKVLRALFDESPVPQWVCDRVTGRILDVNRAAVEHYGHSREAFLAMSLADLEAGSPLSHRRLDGERLDVELHRRDLVLGGRPATLVAAHDVTAHVEAERRLRENAARFRLLADAIPQIVWATSPGDTRPEFLNRRWFDLIGRSPDDPDGWNWAPFVHPDDLERNGPLWAETRERGEASEFEYRVRRPDGSYVWHLGRHTPQRDASGRIVGWFGTATDIDAHKRGESRLRARASRVDELTQSNTALQAFAEAAARDLKEPLRAVTAFLTLLQRRTTGLLDPDSESYLGFAFEGAQRMKRLLSDLLDYSLAGDSSRHFVPIDAGEAVAGALRNLRAELDSAGARVSIGLLPCVFAEPHQLVQLFQRLIENACHFRRGDRVDVRIECDRHAGKWQFTVADDGRGFDESLAEAIFDEFRRVHPIAEGGGAGLGLAICRKIVERHGGRIWATSRPGEGTTIHFTLPTDEAQYGT